MGWVPGRSAFSKARVKRLASANCPVGGEFRDARPTVRRGEKEPGAGEEGPPAYVWKALDILGVDRAGHGVRPHPAPAPSTAPHREVTEIPRHGRATAAQHAPATVAS
nr:hypothetical protein [Streptomyces sp. NBRC 110028]